MAFQRETLLAASLFIVLLSKLRPDKPALAAPLRFLRLLEKEALPRKNSSHREPLWLERKAEGTGSAFRLAIVPGSIPGRAQSTTTARDASGLQLPVLPTRPLEPQLASPVPQEAPRPSPLQNPSSLPTCGNFLLI